MIFQQPHQISEVSPRPSLIAHFLCFAPFFHNTSYCHICCAGTTGCVIITVCCVNDKKQPILAHQTVTYCGSATTTLVSGPPPVAGSPLSRHCHGMGRQLLAGSRADAPKQAIAFMIHKSCFHVLNMFFTYRKSMMGSDCSYTLCIGGVHLSHLLNVVLCTMSVFHGALMP